MYLKAVEVIEYAPGNEARIAKRINKSKVPLLLRPFNGLPKEISKLDLDAFIPAQEKTVTLYKFTKERLNKGSSINIEQDDSAGAIRRIKNNEPISVFGYPVSSLIAQKIYKSIDLFHCWPQRPRYFKSTTAYFMGSKGAHTALHYDRERNCNLHLVLVGRKRLLLFTVDKSRAICKKPFISDSLINLSWPLDEIARQYPSTRHVYGYDVTLCPGEFLYMPKQCWHYVEYIEPSAAVTYAFYPKRIDYILGFLSGSFSLGFSFTGLKIDQTRLYQLFAEKYVTATGIVSFLLRWARLTILFILGPICVTYFLTSLLFRKRIY